MSRSATWRNEPARRAEVSVPSAEDLAAFEFAEQQWGILDLEELRSFGIDRFAAARRARSGHLHRLFKAVYSIVPPGLLRPEGRWLAGVKAAGPDAALFIDSAAAHWSMRSTPSGPVHVVVPSDYGRRSRSGLIIHRCSSLSPAEVTVEQRIPCTTPARTLQDMKKRVSPDRFDSMVRRAEKRGLDTGGIWEVENIDLTIFERKLFALCRRHGLPRPRTQQVIGPYTVDFLWPDARLIVETDDFGTHGTRSGFEADRARDAWLATRGYRVIRFTWHQLQDDPATVVDTLRRLLRLAA